MASKIGYGRPRRPHFVRQWRQFRGLSLEALGERIGASGASISRIEKGEQPYSQEFLEAVAEALGCDVADLLRINPLIPREVEVLELFREASSERRDIAIDVLKGGSGKTGTSN